MFARSVKKEDVLSVVRSGEIIAEYPDDYPFPSYLILGFFGGRPLHVVVSIDHQDLTCYIVTVSQPDPELWQENFTQRRT
jgi:hypothetical protein